MKKIIKSIVKIIAFLIFETILIFIVLFPSVNAFIVSIGIQYTFRQEIGIMLPICTIISCLTLLLPLFVKSAKEIVLNEEEEEE